AQVFSNALGIGGGDGKTLGDALKQVRASSPTHLVLADPEGANPELVEQLPVVDTVDDEQEIVRTLDGDTTFGEEVRFGPRLLDPEVPSELVHGLGPAGAELVRRE